MGRFHCLSISLSFNLLAKMVVRLEQVINKIIDKHETLDHHVEHQFASVYDHIKSLIGKLEKREDKSETRLENLENLIKKVLLNPNEFCVSAQSISFTGGGRFSRKSIECFGVTNERSS